MPLAEWHRLVQARYSPDHRRRADTVQTNHIDWGFRFTTLYGIDYRWTTAQGGFSNQLLGRNSLYGADPVELYGLIYFPHVPKGMVVVSEDFGEGFAHGERRMDSGLRLADT